MKIFSSQKLFYPLTITLFLTLLIFSVYMQSHLLLSRDVSWFLEMTHRFYEGGTYSNNFFEVNPPFVIYTYSLPLWVSHFLNSDKVLSVRLVTFFFIFISLGLCSYLIKKLFPSPSAVPHFLLIGIAAVLLIAPSIDFAQRQHLVIIFILPYLLTQALRLHHSTPKIGILIFVGCLASFGFYQKPHDMLSLLLLELYLMIKQKNFLYWIRTETLLIFFIGIIYLISAWFLTPDYFSTIIPLAKKFYIYYQTESIALRLINTVTLPCFALMAIAFYFTRKQSSPLISLIQMTIPPLIGFFLSYFIQGQLWYSHLLPIICMSLWLLFLLIPSALNEWITDHSQYSLRNILISLCIISSLFSLLQTIYLVTINYRLDKNTLSSILLEVVNELKNTHQQQSFYVFFTSMEPNASLLTYSSMHTASRFPNFWMLPGLVHLSYIAKDVSTKTFVKNTENKLRAMVVEDFKKTPPSVVIIDQPVDPVVFRHHPFNYIDFLSKSSEFKKMWTKYELQTQISEFAIYKRRNNS